jgi:hypothetical protein
MHITDSHDHHYAQVRLDALCSGSNGIEVTIDLHAA